ncbi:hypothetical protein BH10PSE19_BH10PSE19_18410 [soil metagenome]
MAADDLTGSSTRSSEYTSLARTKPWYRQAASSIRDWGIDNWEWLTHNKRFVGALVFLVAVLGVLFPLSLFATIPTLLIITQGVRKYANEWVERHGGKLAAGILLFTGLIFLPLLPVIATFLKEAGLSAGVSASGFLNSITTAFEGITAGSTTLLLTPLAIFLLPIMLWKHWHKSPAATEKMGDEDGVDEFGRGVLGQIEPDADDTEAAAARVVRSAEGPIYAEDSAPAPTPRPQSWLSHLLSSTPSTSTATSGRRPVAGSSAGFDAAAEEKHTGRTTQPATSRTPTPDMRGKRDSSTGSVRSSGASVGDVVSGAVVKAIGNGAALSRHGVTATSSSGAGGAIDRIEGNLKALRDSRHNPTGAIGRAVQANGATPTPFA